MVRKNEEGINNACLCVFGAGGGGVSFFFFPFFLEEAAGDGLKASPGGNRL